MSYVIIGNSTAAVGAVESIRKYDPYTEITLVSDEPYHTYSRPLISYYLGGMVDEERMLYRNRDFYVKNNVKALLGVKAASIDTKNKKVLLEDNRELPYSKLLIATGSKPFIPPIEGLGKQGIYNFLKLDDVKEIEKAAMPGSRALVIGASFSGLKAVEALVRRGVNVTVVDIMSRIMPRVLDDTAANLAREVLEKNGVQVVLNNSVEKLQGADRVTSVLLKDGSKIPCDFVILAIGVRCNADIAKEAGIDVNRGIVVNNRMQTSIPDIYAAGDAAEGYNCIEEKLMEIAIIPNAYYQGETAGANMAGVEKHYEEGFIMNSMPLLGLPIISAGISEEREGLEIKIISSPGDKAYKKFYIKDNLLVGYLLINQVDRAGIYTELIRKKTDISPFKENLGSDDFGFASMPVEMRKAKMLEGGAAS